jgi:hypothetical protein
MENYMLKRIGLFCAASILSMQAIATTPHTQGTIHVSHSLGPNGQITIPNIFWGEIKMNCVTTVTSQDQDARAMIDITLLEGTGTFEGRYIETGHRESLEIYTGYKYSLTASDDAKISIKNNSSYVVAADCELKF